MLRNSKIKYEENKTINVIKAIGASLIFDIIFIGVPVGFIIGVSWIGYFAGRNLFISDWRIIMIVWIPTVYLLMFSKLRKTRKSVGQYFVSLSEEISYEEWYERIVKLIPKYEVQQQEGYLDLILPKGFQISMTKNINNVSKINTNQKRHLILVYSVSEYNEDIFKLNTTNKWVILYNKEDLFTYQSKDKEYFKSKNPIQSIKDVFSVDWIFVMWRNRFNVSRRVKFNMIGLLILMWLFRLF